MTTHNSLTSPYLIKWQTLYSVSFDFNDAFELPLADGSTLCVSQVLRILPKKRVVVLAKWQDKDVVAKLFIDPKEGKRHIQKDVAGVTILQKNRIPTAAIYYQGEGIEKNIQILILEKIEQAINLGAYLKNLSDNEKLSCLERIIVELATQHVLGVLQKDLHFNNFLLTDNIIFTLDGGQIKQCPYLLSKKTSMQNLALFLSQLGIGVQAEQIHLFQYYAKVRGWLFKQSDIDELLFLIKQSNEKRWLAFEKKITRNCSDFHRIQKNNITGMLNRRYKGSELSSLLLRPESFFHHPTAVTLKSGRSATIIKIVLDNQTYVVKRYNIKNIFHWFRRLFRETRAAKNWRLAQQLQFFGIPTAKVAAFVEARRLKLPGPSYVIMEYTNGVQLNDFYIQHRQAGEKIKKILSRTIMLLKNLTKLNITHGDLKAANILIDQELCPVLIDLDGAVVHLSLESMRAAWKKDIQRFLKNFKDPDIIAWIKTLLITQ